MTELEINKIIHEARGLCWHEWEPQESHWNCCGFATCKKCGVNTDREERDYQEQYQNPSHTSSWADYGPMLEWAMKEPWWYDFVEEIYDTPKVMLFHMLNPLRGSTAIAEFLKGRKP